MQYSRHECQGFIHISFIHNASAATSCSTSHALLSFPKRKMQVCLVDFASFWVRACAFMSLGSVLQSICPGQQAILALLQ